MGVSYDLVQAVLVDDLILNLSYPSSFQEYSITKVDKESYFVASAIYKYADIFNDDSSF